MAVNEMKKFSIICQKESIDSLIDKLMWLSCTDIKQHSNLQDEFELGHIENLDSQIAEKNRFLQRIKEVMKLLDKYNSPKWKQYILSNQKKKLFSSPIEIDIDEFIAAGRYASVVKKMETIEDLCEKLQKEKERHEKIRSEKIRLMDWYNYDSDFSTNSTKYTDITLGTLGSKINIGKLKKELDDNYLAYISVVNATKYSLCVSVISHRSNTEDVLKFLSDRGFEKIDFSEYKKSVSEEIGKKTAQEEESLKNQFDIEAQIAHYVGLNIQLEIVYDIISTEIVKLETKKKVLESHNIVIAEGWVPAKCEEKLKSTLEEFPCAYEISEPQAEDDVPVLLQNNSFATPFEPVVSLYSLPKYKTFDPTFVMSFFYIIIFGMMFADVGYGLILSVGCFLALKLLYPRGNMKKFFQMFGICGISCIFWGVMTGGYFGDFIQTVLGIDINTAVWFDPIKDPMTFLILSIVVGVVHIVSGLIIKMVLLIKKKQVFSAIFDVGSWIVIFAGVGVLIIKMVPGLIVVGVGVLMLVLTQGRKEKNIVMKIVKGIGSLYSATSYASDVLSYTRILSLGLASAVIAKVVNIIATLGGKNIIGYLLLIIVLLVGHVLNMTINILGTFVHTSRLQYIEFFGKFYEEGGTPFEVLEPKSKYVLFKNKIK